MAIVIPQKDIFNYNFNILKNNDINKVSINQIDSYNFKKVDIGRIYDDYKYLSTYTAKFENPLLSVPSQNERKSAFKRSSGSQRVSPSEDTDPADLKPLDDEYFVFRSTLQLDDTFSKDFPKKLSGVVAEAPYFVVAGDAPNTILRQGTDTQNLSIEYMETRLFDYNDTSNISDGSLGKIKINPQLTNDYKMEFICYILIKRLTFPELFRESKVEYNIKLEYDVKSVTTTYTYGTNELNNELKIEANPLFSRYNSINNTPIFDTIAENIVSNYQKGKMTLEIETRYTTFKNEDGSYINEGKPYLIKVGDVVKPQMTSKFSNFEYEYIVTSAEYEYDGSDKVYLKLLQK